MSRDLSRRRSVAMLAASCALGFCHESVTASAVRDTKIVAAGPPGGPADFLARLYAQTVAPLLHELLTVHNKAGASGTLAADEVARSAPDGNVLLVAGPAAITAAPYLLRLSYEPQRDLVPVAMLGVGAFVLLVHASLSATTPRELVALAASRPGALTFGSGGNGSAGHLCAELFCQATKVRMTHVPYKGEAQAMNDLLAGRVQMLFTAPNVVAPHVTSGRVRAVAVTTRKRVPVLPAVPTVDESLLAGFEYLSWMALFAPAGTPRTRIEALRAAWEAVRTSAAVADRLEGLAMAGPDDIVSGEALKAFLQVESQRQGRLIRQLGIKAD